MCIRDRNIVDFLIVAICIFIFVKLINMMRERKKEETAEEQPKGPTTEELLTEIRDLLKK